MIERGACLVGLQQFDEALEDVTRALEYGHVTSKALYVKGDALYHLGDFEHSLVFYHRALHRYFLADFCEAGHGNCEQGFFGNIRHFWKIWTFKENLENLGKYLEILEILETFEFFES
jgi:tetratricopeptide (TPR) repeat protein